LSCTVAVQGELGSNSELAAHAYFHDSPPAILPCRSFDELFRALSRGDADYGMAPVDNSLAGSIHEVWDLLISGPLPIAGEIFLHVRHFLIARPGATLEGIRRIYSHEQALAQCQTFLGNLNGVQSEIVYDTAGAVAMVKSEGNDSDAAIAPAQAARDHGMQILAEDIQSDEENYTRFLVLSREEVVAASGDHKSAIVIRLGDSSRGLAAALNVITERGIELEKVESRKLVGQAWEYLCYLELRGSLEDSQVAAAVTQLRKQVLELWVIGSYRPGTKAEPPLIAR
jgi:prephenate dehydratase